MSKGNSLAQELSRISRNPSAKPGQRRFFRKKVRRAIDRVLSEMKSWDAQRIIETRDGRAQPLEVDLEEAIRSALLGDRVPVRLVQQPVEMPESELIVRSDYLVPSYGLAREILGDDFITPNEITMSGRTFYTDRQLAMFEKTVPPRETLEWCRDNGYLLVAGPNKSVSLIDIRIFYSEFFLTENGGWYAERKELFSREERTEPRWLIVRKDPFPGSAGLDWEKQQGLISEPEKVPNTAEVVWCMIVHQMVRSEPLFTKFRVRTSSTCSYGSQVYVGCEDGKITVDNWHDNYGFWQIGFVTSLA